MERPKRRGLRSPGRGALAPLVGGRPSQSVAVFGRAGSGPCRHGPARLAAGRRPRDGRTALRLPAQPQRDRQGRDRRAGLRRGSGSRPRRARTLAQRGRRPAGLRRGPANARHRIPLGGFGIVRAHRRHRGQGPGRRHQRQLSARLSDPRSLVLSHLRSPDRNARRSGRQRHRHRPEVGRRRRPGHDLQCARARGEPAAGPLDSRHRVSDRRSRGPHHAQ